MTLLAPGEVAPADALLMDDTDWDACFRQLTEGDADVAVRCRKEGARRYIQYVMSHYIYVKAAGGIVENSDGQRLLMVRNDRFDLPKGKVEEGETLAAAALRETTEETGLSALQLGALVGKTYHIYNLYGGWHFKQTSWFRMQADAIQPLVPQADEGITECRWLSPAQWCQSLQTSYSTMRVLCRYTTDW